MIDNRFFKRETSLSCDEICNLTQSSMPVVKSMQPIKSVASLEEAGPNDVSCFHNRKYLKAFKNSKAGFCFVEESYVYEAPETMTCFITSSPYRAFGLTASALYPNVDRNFEACSNFIHPTAIIEENCLIEPGAVIRQNAHIGAETIIGANSVIGPGVKIGQKCVVESLVTITHTLMGNNVTILTGTRIGQAGFGFYMDKKGHVKVPQLGRVIIGNNVEIGANTTIDRGSLKDTTIGDGCRIDNLVQIAHNVELGQGCVLVSQVGVSGSTHFGDYVIAAGQAGFAGHLKIGSGARIAGKSGVMKNIPENETVAGYPTVPVGDWHRQSVILSRLVKDSKKKATQ